VSIFGSDSVAIWAMCYLVAHRPLGQCYSKPYELLELVELEDASSLVLGMSCFSTLVDTY
jgi:hypothetical protein